MTPELEQCTSTIKGDLFQKVISKSGPNFKILAQKLVDPLLYVSRHSFTNRDPLFQNPFCKEIRNKKNNEKLILGGCDDALLIYRTPKSI